jgi:hypothetical protein
MTKPRSTQVRKVTEVLNCTVEYASDTGVGCVTEPDSVMYFNNTVDMYNYVKSKLYTKLVGTLVEDYRELRKTGQ